MARYSASWGLALAMAAFCLCADNALALDITPYRTANRNPLVQFYGLPSETSSDLQPAGKCELGLTQDIASLNASDSNAREMAQLDGEQYRWTMYAKYGLTDRFELGLELPYLLQGGGFLDGFIVDWHNFFGLPQGGRDTDPKNRLNYSYVKDGVTRLDMSHASDGLGDISLLAGYQLYSRRSEPDHTTLALRGQLKLPTGSSSDMLGSGSTDLALFITGGMNSRTTGGTVGGFASAGGMYSSDGDILKRQRRNLAGFGTLGLGWSPAEWIAFKVQCNFNTPLYKDSSLRQLGTNASQLTVGGTLGLPDNYLLDIGVGEDIVVNSAPDVTFHLGLSKRF